jgi:ribonuclease HI
MPRKHLLVATDGSCHTPSKTGGYAAIIRDEATAEESSVAGASACTTCQRMELLAVIEGIRAAINFAGPQQYPDITIISDSQYVGYVVDTTWRTRRLLTAKDTTTNLDLIQAMHEVLEPYGLSNGPAVTFQKVQGHTGHELNERANSLAQLSCRKLMAGITPTHKAQAKHPYDEAPEPTLDEEVELLKKPKIPRYKLRTVPTVK